MNQFNQITQQIRSLFLGMTPQSRLMAILLAAGIAISGVFLVQSASTGGNAMVTLFDGRSLSDEQLDHIDIALSDKGLRQQAREGKRIRVPKSLSDVYYKAIADGKAVPEGMGTAVETVLNGGSFLESTKTTEAKHLAAKERDLAKAIERLDPLILECFVKYDEKRTGFSSERSQTASVAIKTRGGKDLTADQRLSIAIYVQKSFAGLKERDIVIYCNSISSVASDDPASIQQSKYYRLKRQLEEDYRNRAEKMLANYGNVRVDVNVDLDPVASEETESLAFNEKPTKLQSVTTKKDAKQQRNSPGGRPGAEPNATSNKGQALSTVADQNSESKEQTESEKLVTGSTIKKSEKVGHETKRVSVSVSIPESYYRKAHIFKSRLLDPVVAGKKESVIPELTVADLETLKKETIRSIQTVINGMLPAVEPGEDKFPRVQVDSYFDMTVPEPPGVSLTETVLAWLSQSWQTIGLMGLVFAALISLRSFAKSTPSSNDKDFERGFDLPLDDAADIDLSSLSNEENETIADENSDEVASGPPRLRTTGGDIKNDLTLLVRENPDAAATLLRNWIGES